MLILKLPKLRQGRSGRRMMPNPNIYSTSSAFAESLNRTEDEFIFSSENFATETLGIQFFSRETSSSSLVHEKKRDRETNCAAFLGNLKLSDSKGLKFAEIIMAGKWPTLFSEGWKVADTIFWGLESGRHLLEVRRNNYVWKVADSIFRGLESGRHYFLRVGKWPTLFSEGWKVADTIFRGLESGRHYFLRVGKWPTFFFWGLESGRYTNSIYVRYELNLWLELNLCMAWA